MSIVARAQTYVRFLLFRPDKSFRWDSFFLGLGLLLVLAITSDRFFTPPTSPAMLAQAESYRLKTNKPIPPSVFTQDGCSLFPDQFLESNFREACLAHDIRYWLGGRDEERAQADTQLYTDVAGSGIFGAILAPLVYTSVHIFGDSWLTKSIDANWGYGYN